jgi:hypothetical protein
MSLKNFKDICLINCHYLVGASYLEASISHWVCVRIYDLVFYYGWWKPSAVQFQQETQVVTMSTFLKHNIFQNNLQKYLNDECAFEYNKDFLEKVLPQVTMKPLFEIGMQTTYIIISICKCTINKQCISI